MGGPVPEEPEGAHASECRQQLAPNLHQGSWATTLQPWALSNEQRITERCEKRNGKAPKDASWHCVDAAHKAPCSDHRVSWRDPVHCVARIGQGRRACRVLPSAGCSGGQAATCYWNLPKGHGPKIKEGYTCSKILFTQFES